MKPNFRRWLIWIIFFSLACGPGPLDFEEFYSLFDPEITQRPKATEYYFYTNNYLNFNASAMDSREYADSLNLATWRSYTNQKISGDDFKEGLYEKNNGGALAEKLQKNGKNEAADYVLLAQKIDKETEKFATYWAQDEFEVNEQLLGDYREEVLLKLASLQDDFLQERYLFQLLKIDAKLNDWHTLLSDYERWSTQIKKKSYISEWCLSRVAGAHLKLGHKAEGILQFARLFQSSPSRRNQADLSVRTLENKDFEGAIKLAQKEEDKYALYALQAIQPFENGLAFLKKIKNPNHPMLELIFTREINKNELNFYAEKNAQIFSINESLLNDDYEVDLKKVAKVKLKAQTYLTEMMDFASEQSINPQVKNKAFWLASLSYCYFMQGDFGRTREFLTKAKALQTNRNEAFEHQLAFLSLMADIKNEAWSEADVLTQIEEFKEVEGFRDHNLLLAISESLADKYLQIKDAKATKSWLSSCKSEKNKFDRSKMKSFLAKSIEAANEDYTYETGTTKSGILLKSDTDLLNEVYDFIAQNGENAEDKKLIELAAWDKNQILLAIGRKEIRRQHFDLALQAFEKCSSETFASEAFQEYYLSVPKQAIGEKSNAKSPLDLVKTTAELHAKKNKSAEDWYNLGLAAYNFSYYGDAWQLSDRYRGSSEIEYGDPSDEDYYTNAFAKTCFEKALAAKHDKELGAKICYMGALCERNQYYLAYTKGFPESYDEQEINYYNRKMEDSVKPTFMSFFSRLKNQYADADYEKQVIKECITYRNFISPAK